MGSQRPFVPSGDTVSISVTSSTGSTSVSTTGSSESVLLTNAGGTLCFVVFGTTSATATTAGIPVLPGAAVIVSRTGSQDKVAASTASGTTTLYITPGYGE